MHEWRLPHLHLDLHTFAVPPAALVMSSFTRNITTFPAILRRTSPTPIGRNPGFLSGGISLHATKASKVLFSSLLSGSIIEVHSFRMNNAIDFIKSD